jgi:hypothetical protein
MSGVVRDRLRAVIDTLYELEQHRPDPARACNRKGSRRRRPATLCCRDAQRSTPFQAIVHLVLQHYAGPDVTVTESKFLHDPDLGEREVDIFVEAEADGDLYRGERAFLILPV